MLRYILRTITARRIDRLTVKREAALTRGESAVASVMLDRIVSLRMALR